MSNKKDKKTQKYTFLFSVGYNSIFMGDIIRMIYVRNRNDKNTFFHMVCVKRKKINIHFIWSGL